MTDWTPRLTRAEIAARAKAAGFPDPLAVPGGAIIFVPDETNTAPVPVPADAVAPPMTAAEFAAWCRARGGWARAAKALNLALGTRYSHQDPYRWANGYRPIPRKVRAAINASRTAPDPGAAPEPTR